LTLDDLLDDPIENARLCAEFAPEHCGACGNWHMGSIMRRAGVDASQRLLDGEEFNATTTLALDKIGGRRGPKRQEINVILVGATDTGLLASLCSVAFKLGGETLLRALRITLVDLCETPLELCRRYAARHALSLEAVKSDFLIFAPKQKADLVLMHGVVRFFPLDMRDAYMMQIGNWMHRNAILISSTHLGDRTGEARMTAARSKAFANVDELSQQGQLPKGMSVDAIKDAVAEGVATGASMPTTFADPNEAIAYYSSVGLPPISFWITNTAGRSPLSAERQYRFRGIAMCQRAEPQAPTDPS